MATKKTSPAAEKTTAKKTTVKPATAKATKAAPKKATITEAAIRAKAEEIYNARMVSGEAGDEQSDWLKAEQALNVSKKK